MTVKRRAIAANFDEFNYNNMSNGDISVGNGVERSIAIFINKCGGIVDVLQCDDEITYHCFMHPKNKPPK